MQAWIAVRVCVRVQLGQGRAAVMKTMQDFELGQTVACTYRLQVDIFKGCITNITPNVTAKLPFKVLFNDI